MGSEKENNKKVGWECDNNSYGHGTVCKPICGPGAFPTGTNNVCVCDKKNQCKWKGYIKDHCQRKCFKLHRLFDRIIFIVRYESNKTLRNDVSTTSRAS